MELKTKLNNIVNNYNTTNIKEICDYLDIEIAYTEFKAKTLESRLMIVDGNGYIFVRPNLDERYENFLIAHELGHYILHYDKNINFNFLKRIYKTRLEKEANEFAIRLLTYDINLKDYKLYYNYPDQGDDGDVIWYETNEDEIIKSHDTLVFWIKNGANDDLQISDFNNKFNTNLDSDHLISIYNAGMANGSARGLKITSNIKDVLDYVLYNMDGVDDTTADKSIVYQNR